MDATPNRAGAVYYNSDGSGVVRFAASVSLLRTARISPYAKVEYSPDLGGDQIDICHFAPNGTCTQYPDHHDGVGIGLGIRSALSSHTSFGVLVGFGKYAERTRNFVEAEGTLNVARHVGLVGTARYMRWTHSGSPHWFAPITAGIRVF